MKLADYKRKEMCQESSLLLDGILVGIVAGIIGIIYRFLITYSEKVIHFFEKNIHENSFYIFYLAIFLVIMGFLAAFMVKKNLILPVVVFHKLLRK